MNVQQLIESAILDAMGLLDESEREQFEAAFRAASPAVQAQVRREQTRLSQAEALLPDVAPPAGLRATVIEAVRRQIAALRTAAPVAGVISPPLMRSRGVSPLWRAAALGLAAAAVVLGVTAFQVYSSNLQMDKTIRSDSMITSLSKEFGPAYVRDVLFGRDTKRVVFKSANPAFKGEASIFTNPEWKQAKFFHNGLTSENGRVYKLAILDDNDNIIEVVSTFNPSGEFSGWPVPLNRAGTAHLALLAADRTGSDSIVGRAELPAPSL